MGVAARWRSLHRSMLWPISLVAIAACAVPTEPRWARGGDVAPPAVDLSGDVERYVLTDAPVVAPTEFRSIVLPASETVVAATGIGRTINRFVTVGDRVDVGTPIIEWSPGFDEAQLLRFRIAELEITLAELENRPDDAAAARAELAAMRADADAQNAQIVTSPVSGVVGRYLVGRATEFEEGDGLVTVGDPGRTRVDVTVPSDAALDIVVGSALLVVDAQNRFADPTPATVAEVLAPSRSPGASDGVLVSAVLPADATLAVGTRVGVTLERRSVGAGRRVEAEAVLNDGLGPFVIVEDDTGWRRVDVELGLATAEVVELLTDLPAGTTLVVP